MLYDILNMKSQIKWKFERLNIWRLLLALKHCTSEFILKSDQHKGAVRRYPDKGACALKWGAPLNGVRPYAG